MSNNNNSIQLNNNASKNNKDKNKKSNAGRKSKYETHVKPKLHLITQWCKNGSTDEQIYKKLRISKDSFYDYKKKHPEFTDALKIGKDDADDLVESALFKRALGYEYEETEESETYNPETGQTVKTRKIIKHLVADTTAQIFWLKNRRPDRWRNNDRLDINTTSAQVEDSAIESTLSILKAREVEKKEKDDLLGEENE
jgi:hypothetical protein